MKVIVDNYEQLTDVVAWVYREHGWSIGQTRIVIHNLGDISYAQLISGNVHLRYPVLVDIGTGHLRLFYAATLPAYHVELSYNDWEDLFN